jgi:hypothetical protein
MKTTPRAAIIATAPQTGIPVYLLSLGSELIPGDSIKPRLLAIEHSLLFFTLS